MNLNPFKIEASECFVCKMIAIGKWREITLPSVIRTNLTICWEIWNQIRRPSNFFVLLSRRLIRHFSHVKAISHYLFHAACALMQTAKNRYGNEYTWRVYWIYVRKHENWSMLHCWMTERERARATERIASVGHRIALKSVMAPWKWSK